MMMERSLQDACAASCRKVQLLTHRRHAEDGAHAFYRALGFQAEAEGFRTYLWSLDGGSAGSRLPESAPPLG